MNIFRRHRHADDAEQKVSASINRLELLTDRLEVTASALEDLLATIRVEDEVSHDR